MKSKCVHEWEVNEATEQQQPSELARFRLCIAKEGCWPQTFKLLRMKSMEVNVWSLREAEVKGLSHCFYTPSSLYSSKVEPQGGKISHQGHFAYFANQLDVGLLNKSHERVKMHCENSTFLNFGPLCRSSDSISGPQLHQCLYVSPCLCRWQAAGSITQKKYSCLFLDNKPVTKITSFIWNCGNKSLSQSSEV